MKILAFLILSIFYRPTFSQDGTGISGKVIDDKLNCLIGVQITNLSNGVQVISDQNGRFEILASSSDTLKFQFVGLTTDKITVNDPTLPVNLVMMDKDVNCLGAIWTERQYRRAYKQIEKQLKEIYKEADKQNIWKNSRC